MLCALLFPIAGVAQTPLEKPRVGEVAAGGGVRIRYVEMRVARKRMSPSFSFPVGRRRRRSGEIRRVDRVASDDDASRWWRRRGTDVGIIRAAQPRYLIS